MRDNDLCATILGIRSPWSVTDVLLDAQQEEVQVRVQHAEGPLPCPQWGHDNPRHDHRERRWRHLDTCQYRTILLANVPRVRCREHGVVQVAVPWAVPGSRITAPMESLIINSLLEANISAVARRLRLRWEELDGVRQRAVGRGLERRELSELKRVGVDETAYQKRHAYVTVVTDLGAGPCCT